MCTINFSLLCGLSVESIKSLMAPMKQDSATFNMSCLLREWDRAPRERRRKLLQDFIDQHWNRSAPELELELAQMASLFLARICVWVKLTWVLLVIPLASLRLQYIVSTTRQPLFHEFAIHLLDSQRRTYRLHFPLTYPQCQLRFDVFWLWISYPLFEACYTLLVWVHAGCQAYFG